MSRASWSKLGGGRLWRDCRELRELGRELGWDWGRVTGFSPFLWRVAEPGHGSPTGRRHGLPERGVGGGVGGVGNGGAAWGRCGGGVGAACRGGGVGGPWGGRAVWGILTISFFCNT